MFNSVRKCLIITKKYICFKKNQSKFFKPTPLVAALLNKNIYIHTGNNLIRRKFNFLFIRRSIKYNIFFKRPLVRPSKKSKK